MLQTSPSPSVLGALSLESGPKSAADTPVAGREEFSQEYDKQVKNVESRESQQEMNEKKSVAENEGESSSEATSEQDTERKAESEQQQAAEDGAASEDEQGGNNLPLEQMRRAVAEVQLEVDADAEVEATKLESEVEALPTATELDLDQESQRETELEIVSGLAEQATDTGAQAGQLAAAVTRPVLPQQAIKQTSEETFDESTLSELGLKNREKEATLASLLSRDAKGERAMGAMARGEKGFDTLLSAMPGRVNTASASIDTLSPTINPLAGQGSSTPLATPAPVAMTLAVPMQQANWGRAMAERVVWMSNANVQEAEIQLNPRELGPIGIKLSVNSEQQASVSFVASHATTREALEQAMPRLREMLSENGLQLAQSDVSEHGFRGRDGQSENEAGNTAQGNGEVMPGDEDVLAADVLQGVGYASPGGVDAFV